MVSAAETARAGLELFESKIRPVLVEHCYECHSASAKQLEGELRLDSRAAMRRGGPSGPAVVPGNPAESVLLSALRHEDFEMPPTGKLSDRVIDDFAKWIQIGAPDPRIEEETAPFPKPSIDLEAGRQFWAFQPPRAAALPAVQDTAWPRSYVDYFILAGLESRGISPAADASPLLRLRRLYLDLVGLPPTPAQMDTFLGDSSPHAWQTLVDRLLASPAFGERWGRHWLDVVRYADSSGGGRTRILSDAWRYRDYVIDAFNSDLSYDQFVVEQIAGDLLPHKSARQRARHLTATSFLVLGPTNYELQDKELLTMEVVDEQIDTVGRAMLGMTIGCARCHDHKFDPIPTRDYYALAGIFRSTRTLIHANVSDFVTRELPVSDAWRRALDQHADAVQAVQTRLQQALSRLQKLTGESADRTTKSVPADSLAGIVVDDTQAEVLGSWSGSSASPRFVGPGYLHDGAAGKGSLSVAFAPDLPHAGHYEVRMAYSASSNRAPSVPVQIVHADGETTVRIDQRTAPPIDELFISLGSFPFSPGRSASVTVNTQETTGHVIADAVQFLPLPELASELEGNRQADPAQQQRVAAARELVASLQNELARLEKQAPPPPPTVMSVRDEEQPGDCFICIRGNVHNPGNEVPRGFLEVANWREGWEIPPDQSGRLELARWITEPRNPLTARVLVNRIWYHLLGKGLVSTADNFGSTGDTPSHPELLDRLAIDFIEHDWSIKQLVRRIVLSRVYQLSSESGQAVAARDPENRWLGRAHRRRLDAEVLRDSMLFCAGRLDMAQGGKTLKPGTTSEFEYDFSSQRRSVYVPVFRNAPLDLFEVFDMANPNLVGGVRTPSTRATQALLLMNSPFVLDQAQAAAEQLLAMAKTSSDDERLIAAYRRVLSRDPTAAEMSLTRQFIASGGTGAEAENPVKVWTAFCQTLFSCVDFRYVH